LQVGLIDGSTCRLRPLEDIPEHFPPHRPGNCKKPPYWCLARVLGILDSATGGVLDSAMGSLKDSEQALLWRSYELIRLCSGELTHPVTA
jgi:hypothetical protein